MSDDILKRCGQNSEDLRDLRNPPTPEEEGKYKFDAEKKNWRAIDKMISAPVKVILKSETQRD